ncbi:MFS general substrate transporter [Mycena filopes]|nr:MFS general substrate transporter [Mycena filopes]
MASEQTPLIQGPVEATPRRDFALLMTGLWSLTFISSLDATVSATLISTIGSSLESMRLSSWIGTAYLLSLCAFTPLYGRLANILGRRPSILFAGDTMPQLLASRALAGVGGSGMTVLSSVIVSDTVPLKSRGLYQGFTNLLFGLGGAIGAPLGGWLGDTIGWRAAFLCQSPVLACSLLLLYLKVREPDFVLAEVERSNMAAKLKRIDYAGSTTLAFALLTFLLGLSFNTTLNYEWSDPRVWGLLVTGIVLGCLFLVIELKFAREPILPLGMLKHRTPFFVALNNFLIAVLTFSTVYNTPLYFTAARLRTSANAGAHLIPNSVCVAIGSLFAGWYMRRTGRYWAFTAGAALCVVSANLVLATWSKNTPEWVLYTTLMPSGFGFAATLTTTLLALIASVSREDIPVATGLSYLARTTGQVLGVSLSAALAQTVLARNLRARIKIDGADEIITRILDSTAYIHTLSPELQELAKVSWARALRVVFYCQIVVAISYFLSTLPIEEYSLPDTIAGKPVRQTASGGQVERDEAA